MFGRHTVSLDTHVELDAKPGQGGLLTSSWIFASLLFRIPVFELRPPNFVPLVVIQPHALAARATSGKPTSDLTCPSSEPFGGTHGLQEKDRFLGVAFKAPPALPLGPI